MQFNCFRPIFVKLSLLIWFTFSFTIQIEVCFAVQLQTNQLMYFRATEIMLVNENLL